MFSSAKFRKIFLIWFVSYLLIFSGLIFLFLNLEPFIGEEGRYQVNQLLGRSFKVAQIAPVGSINPTPKPSSSPVDSFGGVLNSTGSQIIIPKDTDFGIVIEKIDANSKVIANVDPNNEAQYTKALLQGVAHVKGTVFPGQKGNIYLFSHSVGASWNVVRYNAVFYLLGKLTPGDKIVMFYQGRRYDYVVFDKTIAKPSDTHFLTDTYDQSVLTLQTCDPPGTLVNRLIIRARLASL